MATSYVTDKKNHRVVVIPITCKTGPVWVVMNESTVLHSQGGCMGGLEGCYRVDRTILNQFTLTYRKKE